MEPARFMDLKKKGAIQLMSIGKGHFAIGIRKFDPTNGAELEPELERMTREDVEKVRKAYEDGLESCKALLAEMDAVAPPVATPAAAASKP